MASITNLWAVNSTVIEMSYAIVWWLTLELVGWLAWPLAFRFFRHLPDRGYAFTRPLGLILVNYALWMLSTLGFLKNTWGNILFAMLLVLAVAVFFYRRARTDGVDLWAWMREHWCTILAVELVFTLAFVLWVGYKMFDPNIAITEKPMEFAFLNAILRSDRFPAYDPWMSGYGISYYYFGYIMIATLAKFGGIPSSIAFNLGIATLFALTASGAFGIVYNIVYASAAKRRVEMAARTAIYYGIIAAILIPLAGNLEGVLEFAHANGLGVTDYTPGNVTGPFWEWINVKGLIQHGALSETWYPTDGWWWWRASRVIHDIGLTGEDMEVIDEFPAFSFLLGDMHPHVLAYPFIFMLIALAFNLLLSQVAPSEADWWLVYLCLGAIGFLNTWDMPFYFFILVMAYFFNRYLHARSAAQPGSSSLDPQRSSSLSLIERGLGRWISFGPAWLQQVVYRAVELLIASIVLYLPYWLYARPKAGTGILPNLFNVARFSQLFLMFGTFFVVLAAMLVVMLIDMWRKGTINGGGLDRTLLRRGLSIWAGTMAFFPLLLVLVLAPVLALPSIRTYINDMLSSEQVRQFLGPQTLGSLLQISLRIRLGLLPQPLKDIHMPAGPWTFIILSLFIAAIIFWVVQSVLERWPGSSKQNTTDSSPLAATRVSSEEGAKVVVDPSLLFAMLLAFTGLMLVFSVEFVYLRDAFGTRMNTVFKFYFQAWALLGIVAAFGMYYLLEGRDENGSSIVQRVGKMVFGALCALLLFGGLLYPLGMSIERTGGFGGPATLDGVAFVARDRPEEYAAIRWLNDHVKGNPVIVEAVRGSFAYEYARVSSRTGLPAVMGWTGHEGQWHGLHEEISEREQDVKTLYGGSIADAKSIMAKYDVTYVYVGYLERNEFGTAVDKFARFMDVAFQEGATVIYKKK